MKICTKRKYIYFVLIACDSKGYKKSVVSFFVQFVWSKKKKKKKCSRGPAKNIIIIIIIIIIIQYYNMNNINLFKKKKKNCLLRNYPALTGLLNEGWDNSRCFPHENQEQQDAENITV